MQKYLGGLGARFRGKRFNIRSSEIRRSTLNKKGLKMKVTIIQLLKQLAKSCKTVRDTPQQRNLVLPRRNESSPGFFHSPPRTRPGLLDSPGRAE